MDRNRQRTAIHEAGHCVAADAFKLARRAPSIRCDGSAGRVWIEEARRPGAHRDVWVMRQAVIDYAGHAAVVALLDWGSMSEASARAHGAGDDFRRARARLVGDPALIEQAKARAVQVVTSKRKAATAMADTLVAGGRPKYWAAVQLGRLGGLARAAVLSPQRRSEIASKAAAARWSASKRPRKCPPRGTVSA